MTANTSNNVSPDKGRKSNLTVSRRIAGLMGPALIAIVVSELEFLQPNLYDEQIAPVVYLSGTLFFVAGLAVVRAHNRWTLGWPVLITLMGWFALLGGLFRMFAASSYPQAVQNPSVVLPMQLVLLFIGMVLTLNAYWPRGEQRLTVKEVETS